MKRKSTILKGISLLLCLVIILSSCASTTVFQSTPTGAKLYLNGESVGKTPYTYTDTKIVGSTTTVKLELNGYEPLNTSISRNEEVDAGAVIGGLFFLFPFLWTMKYKSVHAYELIPINPSNQTMDQVINNQEKPITKSKADRLREIKKLLDEKILTQEEYEKEKAKILAEKEY